MLQKGQFFIECPGQPTVLEMLLQDPVLAAALSAKRDPTPTLMLTLSLTAT